MRAPAEMRAAERKEWIGLPLTRETLEHKIEAYLALQRAQESREVAWRRTVLLNRTEVLDFLDFLCFAVTDEPGEWDFLGAAARYSPEELGLFRRMGARRAAAAKWDAAIGKQRSRAERKRHNTDGSQTNRPFFSV